MIRTILFFLSISLSNLSFAQENPQAHKDAKHEKEMAGQKETSKPTTGQVTPVSVPNTTIPAGKCCNVKVSYPANAANAKFTDGYTTNISSPIPGLTSDECAKSTCKVQVIDDKGRPVLKGWSVVSDKNKVPTIDASKLPVGKYRIKFVSGVKSGEKLIEIK